MTIILMCSGAVVVQHLCHNKLDRCDRIPFTLTLMLFGQVALVVCHQCVDSIYVMCHTSLVIRLTSSA